VHVVVKEEVKQEAAPAVKMEVKQEAAPEVKLEVKDEPPSPPRGQLPASRPTKRARTETPLPPPLPEPWMAAFSIPLIYRCHNNGEWAGYNTVVRLLAAEYGIVVIDDDNGGVGADAKGKVPL
jgi:hypothetical protein